MASSNMAVAAHSTVLPVATGAGEGGVRGAEPEGEGGSSRQRPHVRNKTAMTIAKISTPYR